MSTNATVGTQTVVTSTASGAPGTSVDFDVNLVGVLGALAISTAVTVQVIIQGSYTSTGHGAQMLCGLDGAHYTIFSGCGFDDNAGIMLEYNGAITKVRVRINVAADETLSPTFKIILAAAA